jgi:hypothetical protein
MAPECKLTENPGHNSPIDDGTASATYLREKSSNAAVFNETASAECKPERLRAANRRSSAIFHRLNVQ